MAGGAGAGLELPPRRARHAARRAAALPRVVRGAAGGRAGGAVRDRLERGRAAAGQPGRCSPAPPRPSCRRSECSARRSSAKPARWRTVDADAVFNPAARGLVEPHREALTRYDLIGLLVTLAIAFLTGAFGLPAPQAAIRRPHAGRADGDDRAAARLAGGDPDHARHLRQPGVRDRALLRHGQPGRLPVRHPLGPRPDEQPPRTPTATARCRCSGGRSTSARSSPWWSPSCSA